MSTEYTREQSEIDRKKFAAGVKARLEADEKPGRPLYKVAKKKRIGGGYDIGLKFKGLDKDSDDER